MLIGIVAGPDRIWIAMNPFFVRLEHAVMWNLLNQRLTIQQGIC